MTKILVTGGLGFIGSNFLEFILKKKNYSILNIDKITYASNLSLNKKFKTYKNYDFKKLDLTNLHKTSSVIKAYKPNFIIHFAAESHVDNSILSPDSFLKSNVIGTFSLLEAIKKNYLYLNFKKFIHISTDEIYGDMGNKKKSFTELNQIFPSSPYSASKAASDCLVQAWGRTFKIPYLITNCCNNYGKYQNIEKFIPNSIIKIKNNQKIPIYGNGNQSREWINAKTHVKYLYKLMKLNVYNQRINIGSEFRIKNLDLAKLIVQKIKNSKNYDDHIIFVKDRQGHDVKYQINSNKLYSHIKKINENFNHELSNTIKWYWNN